MSETVSSGSEFIETRSVHLEWRVAGLKTLFENSKGESKSKCVKSALFDSHRWQIFFYPNSGHEQYSSIYLSCEPTADEKEKGAAEALRGNSTNTQFGTDPLKSTPISTGHAGSGSSSHIKPTTEGKTPWRRDGKFKFTFEARSLDRRMTFKQMEATDHSFSDTARNWGYQNFWKRSDAWFNNPTVRANDAFLLICTIIYSPTAPSPPPPLSRLLIPKDLVRAYGSLFDDPTYSDVVFRIRPTGELCDGTVARERRLFASKKILKGRCEYFDTMFSSGFTESLPTFSTNDDPSPTTPRFGSPLNSTTSRRRSRRSSTDGDYDHVEQEEDDWDEDDDSDLDSHDEEESVSESDAMQSAAGEGDAVRSSETEGGYNSGVKTHSTDDEAHSTNGDSSIPTIVTESRHARTTSDQSLTSPNFNVSFVDAISSPTRHRFHDSGAIAKRDLVRSDRRGDDGRARFEVVVTDASYSTFRALIYYIYTDSITFAPLSSTYKVAQEEDSPSLTKLAKPSSTSFLGDFEGGLRPCSSKAIYRLADKLGLKELKERAFDFIISSLTVKNIPYEVFGSFSLKFEEVKRIEIAFLLEKWNEVRVSPGMKRVFNHIRYRRYPGFEDVWLRILESLEYRPREMVEAKEERDSPDQL